MKTAELKSLNKGDQVTYTHPTQGSCRAVVIYAGPDPYWGDGRVIVTVRIRSGIWQVPADEDCPELSR